MGKKCSLEVCPFWATVAAEHNNKLGKTQQYIVRDNYTSYIMDL